MPTLTWLHLSDLHFRAGERDAWDKNIVLSALLNDITGMIQSEGMCPDFIAVSGDIADSGKLEEYERAEEFLRELLEVTQVPVEHLYLVPGNHDVDRGAISPGAKTIASSLGNRQSLNEVMAFTEDRRLILRKLDNFSTFLRTFLGEDRAYNDERYFNVEHLDCAGKRVALLCLNSAVLSGSDKEYGGLALGEVQVRTALDESDGADLRIAMLHHPFNWLQEFDRPDCEDLLMDGCRFILHGHLHRAGLLTLQTPDAGAMVIAAGACYETREYPNGYNWVRLDVESGEGTVFLRTYSDKRGGFWTKDMGTYKNVTDGEFVFTMPGAAKKVLPDRVKRRAPSISPTRAEAGYLKRVRETCNALPLAVIDPRAVERTRQRTMDLLCVYIALNTRTPVPVEGEEAEGKERKLRRGDMVNAEGETKHLSALEAASRERQMVLLGDPGSGKSTFINYLALCLAGARLEEMGEEKTPPGGPWLRHLEPAWTHGAPLPLQVILRHFAKGEECDGTARGLRNYIARTLDEQGFIDFVPLLLERLEEGDVLVLLDGLDEVADPEKRQAVRDAVSEFSATYGAPIRYVVTCRGYAYQDVEWQLDRFTSFTLAPFDQEQIDSFIACWYNEVCRLGWKSEVEAEELTRRLREATRRPDLAPLAENPLQLAMMASLHFSWGRLPDDRVELYQEMVRLLLVRWQEARLGEEAGVTQKVRTRELELALARVAFDAHMAQQGTEGTADVSEATLRSILKDCLGDSWDLAGEMVAYIQERAGLLIDKGNGVYTFPHRSYQEYLAGSHLAVQDDYPDLAAALTRENYTQWREVVLWAAAVMARLNNMPHIAVDAVAELCPQDVPLEASVSDIEWRAASLAGEAVLEIGLETVKARERHAVILERVNRWLTALIERGAMNPVDRAAAGRVLARLGDRRPGVGLTPLGEKRDTALPDIVWCEIPAGPFVMGSNKKSDEDAYDDENPRHEEKSVTNPYFIARYPVTNMQFDAFVRAGGYRERRYWIEAEAAGVWHEGVVKGYVDDVPRGRPFEFGERFNLQNHPVVGVTWYEALAFCRWLTEQIRTSGHSMHVWRDGMPETLDEPPEDFVVRLPTEAEWEKAARGPDGSKYPWNDEFGADRCNSNESGMSGTSAVGIFPRGRSPYGALDLAGNVLEWCGTKWVDNYKKYARVVSDRESLEGEDPRVLRGGSWGSNRTGVRCAFRDWLYPGYRLMYYGFRVVGASGSPGSGL
jgi:formylglycine-generating enzyme required for sulfatase activity/predicted MPP superfamily phosphohydrolase